MSKRAPNTPLSATNETGGTLTRSRARLQAQSAEDIDLEIYNIEPDSSKGGSRGGRGGRNGLSNRANENNEVIVMNHNNHQESTDLNQNGQNINQEVQLEESQINNPPLNHQNSNPTIRRSQYSVSEMFKLAKKHMYPKKCIYFGNNFEKKKEYTSVLNFYDHPIKFKEKPKNKEKIYFICRIEDCETSLQASLGAVTNLNTHLKQHESTKAWYNSFKWR